MPKYDEGLAERVRLALSDRHDVVEQKMFGGLCFMVSGHMCVGVETDRLMVRVGKGGHAEALAQPGARPMDFTGRPMKGFVFVDVEGLAEDEDLDAWVGRGLRHALSLPPR